MAAEEFLPELWVYAGRRLDKGDKLYYLWIYEDEALSFTKLKGAIVGGEYQVTAQRTDDTVYTRGKPVYEGPSEDARTAEWELEDRAAYTADLVRKREAKAKRDGVDALSGMTLGQFRMQMSVAPAMQRAAMLARLLRYVGAA